MTLSDMLKELPQYGEKLGLEMRWASMGRWLEIGDLNHSGIITPNGSEVGNARGKEMLRESLVRISPELLGRRPRLPDSVCCAIQNSWADYTTENVVKAVYEAVKA